MITPLLERAVLAGLAEVKTHMHTISAVSKIIVPENHKAIITSFSFHPFCDVTDLSNRQDPYLQDKYSQHVIDFFSRGNNRCSWMIRNNFEILNDPSSAEYIQKPSEPIIFNTLMIHEQDIYVSINGQWGVEGATAHDFGQLVKSQNQPLTSGYGQNGIAGVNVIKRVDLADGTFYYPVDVTQAGGTPSNTDSNQPYSNTAVMGLPNPFNDQANWLTPLVNVHYVLINKLNLDKLLKEKY